MFIRVGIEHLRLRLVCVVCGSSVTPYDIAGIPVVAVGSSGDQVQEDRQRVQAYLSPVVSRDLA